MKQMRRVGALVSLSILSCCLTLTSLAAWAQSRLSVQAQVSQTQVTVGESFELQVSVKMEGDKGTPDYTPPTFQGFEVLSESTARSQSFTLNFGSAPQSQSTLTYSYALRAKQAGKLEIGPARAKSSAGDWAQSAPITINVTADSAAPEAANPSAQANQGAFSIRPNELVALRIVPSTLTPYVGEQVTLSLFLLSRVNLMDLQNLTQPSLSGVLIEREEQQRTLTPHVQTIGGVQYQVFEIARFYAFCLRAEEVTLGSFGVTAMGEGAFMMNAQNYRLTSPKVTLKVKPLPANGKPKNFNAGNVGHYQIKSELLSAKTEVGKPVTLRVTITGEGHLKQFDFPEITWPEGIKAFAPETKTEQRVAAGQWGGSLVRNYLLMPEKPGVYELSSPHADWFDPVDGRYHESPVTPLHLEVTGQAIAPEKSAATPPQALAPAAPSLDPRLEPIRTHSLLASDVKAGENFKEIVIAIALLGASLLLIVGRMAWAHRKPRMATAKKNRGIEPTLKRLSALHTNESSEVVYAAIQKAIRDYLQSDWGIDFGATHDTIRAQLQRRNISTDMIDALIRELNHCDFARFAGDSSAASTEVVERVQLLLKKLHAQLK